MNEEEELRKELERYERQNQEAYDEVTKGNEELRRRQEGSLDRRKRIYPDYKKNRSRNRPKFSGGSPGQVFTRGKDEEIRGPDDEDMRTGAPIYEQNRAINDAFRFNQPNRAFQQYKTISEYFPKPTLADVAETYADFKAGTMGGSLIADYVPLPKGVVPALTGAATAVVKKVNPRKLLDVLDEAFNPANSVFKRAAIPEGLEMPMMMSENLGGFGKEANKKIFEIQQSLRPKTNQMDLFANPSDADMLELYKSQNKVIGQKPLPKRAQAGRALRPTDFDAITTEFPDITPDHIFGYIEQVKAGKLGKRVYKPSIQRRQFSQKGLEGTLRFLNQKAAYSPNFDLSEIAAELTAEFGLKGSKVITPKTIENLILDQGGISFRTRGMKKAVQINSIDDLREVYMGRLARYKAIPAFERGHVFAADNIIKDNRIANLTDFKNNLEPEIGRSIYRQLDDEALNRLIKENVDRNFDDIEDTYQSVLEGNRKRKNLDDPDKVLADLYGTQYGLRESFLSYVYPDRSLGRLIPADLKAAFTDLYKKELEMALLDFKGLSVGPYALDQIKNKVAVDVLKSFPDVDTRGILEQLTLMSDKAYGRDMVDYLTGEAF